MAKIVNLDGSEYIPPIATLADAVNPEVKRVLDALVKQQSSFAFIMVGLRYLDDENTYILFNESILKDTALAMAEEIKSQVSSAFVPTLIYEDEEVNEDEVD